MEETIYYQNGDVLVTNSRFVTGGKTYAMRNISSVQMGKIVPNNSFWIIALLVSIIVIIAGSMPAKFGAGLFAVFCFLAIRGSKTKYTVRINSNSGEVDGLASNDQAYINTIISAINQAIIGSPASSSHSYIDGLV